MPFALLTSAKLAFFESAAGDGPAPLCRCRHRHSDRTSPSHVPDDSAAISRAVSDQPNPTKSGAGWIDPQYWQVRCDASAAKWEETSWYFACDNVAAVSHTSR